MKTKICLIFTMVMFFNFLHPMSIYADNNSNVSEATYIFQTALNTNMVMDAYGNNYSNGTNIQIYNFNGGDNQKFDIFYVKNGWYKILLTQSNKAIDVCGGIKGSNVNVQLYNYNGTDAQLWRFIDAGDGYYYIQNKLGYYLDVCGGICQNETNIIVYDKNYSDNQKWKLSRVLESECKIVTALNKNMVMDVYGDWQENGANIQIYNDNDQDNQRFYIVHYQNGWYAIISKSSGKAIDVTGAEARSGVNVQLYDLHWGDAQLWRFIDIGDGYYYIQNKLGYYLDVCGGSDKNETNVIVYNQNNSTNQKWKIILTGNQYYHDSDDSYFTEIKNLSFDDFDSWETAVRAAECSIANIRPTYDGEYNAAAFIVDKQILEWKTVQEKVSLNTPGYYQTIDVNLPSKILYTYHKHSFEIGYGKSVYIKSDALEVLQTCECGYRTEWTWSYPLEDFSSKANVSLKQQVIWKPRFYN